MGEHLKPFLRLLCLCLLAIASLPFPCEATAGAVQRAAEGALPALVLGGDRYAVARRLIAWGNLANEIGERQLACDLFERADDFLFGKTELSREASYDWLATIHLPDYRVRVIWNLWTLGEKPERLLELLDGLPLADAQGYELLGRAQLLTGQNVDALQSLLTAALLDRELAPGKELTLRRLGLYDRLGDAFALNGNLRAARLAWREAHAISWRLRLGGYADEMEDFLPYDPLQNRLKRLAASTLLRPKPTPPPPPSAATP